MKLADREEYRWLHTAMAASRPKTTAKDRAVSPPRPSTDAENDRSQSPPFSSCLCRAIIPWAGRASTQNTKPTAQMGQKRRTVFFHTVTLKNDVPDRIVLTSHFINKDLLQRQG